NIQIGVLNSLPRLFVSLSQLKTADLVERFGSRKRLIVPAVFLHAISFIPIALTPFLMGNTALLLLILGYTWCMVSAHFAGPAWGSMMSDLVPVRRRGSYFGRRDRLLGFVSVLSVFLAGYYLNWIAGPLPARKEEALFGFFVVFLVAGSARTVSGYLMTLIYDPPLRIKEEHYFSFWDFLKRAPEGNFGRYVTFVATIHFATLMSAPFFAVFMLRDLGFSYLTYSVLVTVAHTVALLSGPFWGRYADKVGNLKVLRICSCILPLLPVLWTFSQDVRYLFFVQILSGIGWGGFNLCSVNFVYESAIPEKRTRCMSYYSATNGVAAFVGTLLGGFLASHLPHLMGYRLLFLFLLSGTIRALAGLFLLTKVKEVRGLEAVPGPVPTVGARRAMPLPLGPGLEEGAGG
ncbi:MAG: MFS transporter, partial [Candidatus Brocadiales bacterium]